ncbi:MAG: hypothetical protein FWD68_16275 [Alphaproteobacteria bacterium]|nr:hypothetical protein [Alphaproteobacteria bacterium]
MSSKRVGGIVGAIVAMLVLGVAILSGPMDRQAPPRQIAEHSVVAAPAVADSAVAAPAGVESGAGRTVIREVPN